MNIGKATFFSILLVAAAIGAVAQSQAPKVKWIWDDKFDSVNAAPNIHKVLFENDHLRLLEVTIHAGEKEPMHGHKYPSVFAYDAPQPNMTNEEIGGETRLVKGSLNDADFPTCRTMGIQAPHSVKITDTFQQHFYRLEFKTIDGSTIHDKP